MIARRIQNATSRLVAPEGNPDVVALWVRAEVHGENLVLASAWEPTPAELAILNAGGSVVLRVMGGQPPVSLTAERAE